MQAYRPAFSHSQIYWFMNELFSNVTQLKDHVSEYAKTYVDLAKVKATKTASNAAAGATIGIALLLFGLFFLQFLFLGLAWWMASLVDSAAGGFFIVAGFFLLLIIVIVALRKKVIVPFIRNTIVRKMYE